ncbi:AfsR/SARP family transcriptional regulator (plasmid) [Streptomyces sp. BI20]|uniref:AfsR/SARP family transcriptional regulator n=1 Tax=Streptomyces sp. BI20 TaxID=3403460 RepID=UPI003C737E38
MRIGVLGPLHAELDGVDVVPTADKKRRILALLALHPGRLVPVADLAHEVWGPCPPRSAHNTLQTYVLRLRRDLAAAHGGPEGPARARALLATGHGGYLLRIDPGDVDAHAFTAAARTGHAAFAAGDPAGAARELGRALALWRGPALVDLAGSPGLRIRAAALEEERLLALERRLDAELRLGRHDELLPELVELTGLHPTNERLHSQAMVAFHRAGRSAVALELYRELRRRLVGDLGLEPSIRLQRLHRAVLTLDPRLEELAHGGRPTPTFDLYAA